MARRENLDRVRAHTPPQINEKIEHSTRASIEQFAPLSKQEIAFHVKKLEREWDIDRALEMSAATLSLAGVVLAAAKNTKWLILPALVGGMLLNQAVAGWCPPVTLFRRLGVRTRREIDEEKYALKAIRGDFNDVAANPGADYRARAGAAFEGVRA